MAQPPTTVCCSCSCSCSCSASCLDVCAGPQSAPSLASATVSLLLPPPGLHCRGRSGGMAVWEATTPEWEAASGVMKVYK